MDKLAAMAAFVEIVDRGSLTAAAEALGKAQPTMVRSLANLEAHLGVRLLRRTTRRLALTPEGRDYLERCRRILADVDEAERVLDAAQPAPAGALRVTAPVTFGHLHVMPVVSDFVRRWPEVSIDVLLLDRPVNLLEEGIDLAVRIGPLADSTMVALPAGSMRLVVAASPRLLEQHGVPAAPLALASLPCVQFHGGVGVSHWAFMVEGRRVQVPVSPRLSVNHALSAADACAAGLGFGRFLEYQVRDLVQQGRLEIVLAAFEPSPQPISLLTTDARLVSHRLRLFRAALRDALTAGGQR
jgi:DNA-binding transcriptional LysR family regulator